MTPAPGFTVDDLDQMPDDGRRYGLVDGVLIVSPSPVTRHQLALMRLLVILDTRLPRGVRRAASAARRT